MEVDEWDEMERRFQEEGLEEAGGADRKLLLVWRWLVDAETNCISLRHQIDKIRRRQEEQLEEVRRCMGAMCERWEAKVSALEEENRRTLQQLESDSHHAAQLIQREGLAEIATLTPSKQVACLLQMRSRLQSQLEQEVLMRRKCEQLIRNSSNLPDCLKLPYIQRILDRQKDEYEEELRGQQCAMKAVKEQLRAVHEQELQHAHADNQRMRAQITQLAHKLQELVVAQQEDKGCLPWVQHILDGSHESELRALQGEVSELQSLCSTQRDQMRDQAETVRMLQRHNKQLEIDNETLAFKLSESLAQFDELEDQLRREATRGRRETVFRSMSCKDEKNMNLDNRPNTQDEDRRTDQQNR